MADIVEVAKMTAAAEAEMQKAVARIAEALDMEVPEPPVTTKPRQQFRQMELFEYITEVLDQIYAVVAPEPADESEEPKPKKRSKRG